MKLLNKRTGDKFQPFKAVVISEKEIKKRLKAGEIVQLDGNVYQEKDPSSYKTKVMKPETKTSEPDTDKSDKTDEEPPKKKRGRPRKNPE